MKKIKEGFAFPAIVEADNVGVKEEFDSIISDGVIRVNAIFGIDSGYSVLKPAIIYQDELISLEEMVKNSGTPADAFEKFLKSHKPTYSVLKSVLLLVKVSGKYNAADDSWSEDTNVRFFSPSKIGHSTNADYLICSEAALYNGLSTIQVAKDMLGDIQTKVLDSIKTCISDRALFLGTRSGLQEVMK